MSDVQRAITVPEIERQEHRRVNDVAAKAVVPYGFDGTNIVPKISDTTALQLDTTSTAAAVYIGVAPVGTATSAAAWQVYKISTSGGIAITWAGGSSAFTNVWDNRTSFTYS